ncbi:MAG TPA: chemotaxis protein CheW [Planctomycetota bacterium]|nr:chemotaxis protein CheW [Planctomycetota bacterium]
MENETRYCTFHLGEAEYALDVADIGEVLRDVERCAVPLAPASVLGLTNLRGQIVTLLDLATRLGHAGAEARAVCVPPVSIVLTCARPPLGLCVDAIGDVVTLSAASLLPPPATLDERTRALVRGVHLSGERLITVLETKALLAGFLEDARG